MPWRVKSGVAGGGRTGLGGRMNGWVGERQAGGQEARRADVQVGGQEGRRGADRGGPIRRTARAGRLKSIAP